VTLIEVEPSWPAGVTAVIWVAESTTYDSAGWVPNLTADTHTKFKPVMTTDSPPTESAVDDESALITGDDAAEYVNFWLTDPSLVPPGVVTLKNQSVALWPHARGGATTVTAVEPEAKKELTFTIFSVELVALLPSVTADAPFKFAPLRVTEVPNQLQKLSP
jgi:hypothetical protein